VARACYQAADDAEAQAASWAMEADRTFVWSSLTAARMQAATGSAPAWHYRFDRAPVIPASDDVIEREYAGAFHTAEVPYVFGTLDVRPWPWTAEDRALARAMAGAWSAFARTGDPNGGDRPAWPRYEDGKDTTLVWDVEPHVGRPLHPERLAFLDRFNAAWDGSAASVARREDRLTASR
jgi:para-nitrobenzyl esterase